jgi:DNA polymerase V
MTSLTSVRFDAGAAIIAAYVPCGQPMPTFDDSDTESLEQFLRLRKGATFYYIVQGNSMTGAGFENGNVAIVDTDMEPQNGDIVLARINGELTMKTLKLRITRTVENYQYQRIDALIPENPHHHAISLSENDDVQIYGVVVGGIWSNRKRR